MAFGSFGTAELILGRHFLMKATGAKHEFWSREREIRALAERAWRERLRITVEVEGHEPRRPLRIIFREPPAPFNA